MKHVSHLGVQAIAQATDNNAPLIEFALRGLRRCWLPEYQRWSHIYHLDGRETPNQSVPHSDVFYTLNVLLGMSQIAHKPADVHLHKIFHHNARQLTVLPVRDYALGMALWAAAELDVDLEEPVAHRILTVLEDRARWPRFLAQDLGMLLIGVVAQSRAGRTDWREFAAPLFEFLSARFPGGSGLFMDASQGLRRRFASFATQVYLSLACYQYGEFTGDAAAIGLANACVRKLIALQGPQGEWPWFYDAVGGQVIDFYEVYSVHQYGMAPALLEWAERHGEARARDALVRGFEWVTGANQLGRSMMLPDLGLSVRSQIRKGERDSKAPRMMRSVGHAFSGRASRLINASNLDLRLECRSYELGWILWSFGRRPDLRSLADRPVFNAATA